MLFPVPVQAREGAQRIFMRHKTTRGARTRPYLVLEFMQLGFRCDVGGAQVDPFTLRKPKSFRGPSTAPGKHGLSTCVVSLGWPRASQQNKL